MKPPYALIVAAVSLALTAPAAARAVDPATQDVSCLVLAMATTQSADPTVKQGGAVAMSYFLGRWDGRGTPKNLQATLQAQIALMTPERAKAEQVRCQSLMTNRGQALQSAISNLKPRAK